MGRVFRGIFSLFHVPFPSLDTLDMFRAGNFYRIGETMWRLGRNPTESRTQKKIKTKNGIKGKSNKLSAIKRETRKNGEKQVLDDDDFGRSFIMCKNVENKENRGKSLHVFVNNKVRKISNDLWECPAFDHVDIFWT